MKSGVTCTKLALVLGIALSLLPNLTFAQHYKETNLVSDIMGMAPTFDPNLKNPWGLSRSPFNPTQQIGNQGSPWWVSDNNSGKTTLYNGNDGSIIPINGTGFVTIPPPKGADIVAAPTGTVFNGSPTDFVLPNGKAALFLFATEDGTISGWNGGPSAVRVVDKYDGGSSNGAVYKGLTSGEIDGSVFCTRPISVPHEWKSTTRTLCAFA